MRQNFWIIIVVVVVIFGGAWYAHRAKAHPVNRAAVPVRGQEGDKAKADAAEPAAGSAAPQVETQEDSVPATAEAQPGSSAQSDAPVSAQAAVPSDAVAPPAGDTIPRNPPNGMMFAGKGKFQLYRQGDITWRVDTETGQACVLFATHAEWRNPLVLQHGCGSN